MNKQYKVYAACYLQIQEARNQKRWLSMEEYKSGKKPKRGYWVYFNFGTAAKPQRHVEVFLRFVTMPNGVVKMETVGANTTAQANSSNDPRGGVYRKIRPINEHISGWEVIPEWKS